jgi:hypothetical protein
MYAISENYTGCEGPIFAKYATGLEGLQQLADFDDNIDAA